MGFRPSTVYWDLIFFHRNRKRVAVAVPRGDVGPGALRPQEVYRQEVGATRPDEAAAAGRTISGPLPHSRGRQGR